MEVRGWRAPGARASVVVDRVIEMNTQSLGRKPENLHGNAFTMSEHALANAGGRSVNFATSRWWWKVQNQNTGAGYALIPSANAPPFAAPESQIRKRAGFLNAQFWATPYDSAQMYAAGDYPNRGTGDGLVKSSEQNQNIQDCDVVIWYVLGVTHNPRPEDWPVMPSHYAGFLLSPNGFFQ